MNRSLKKRPSLAVVSIAVTRIWNLDPYWCIAATSMFHVCWGKKYRPTKGPTSLLFIEGHVSKHLSLVIWVAGLDFSISLWLDSFFRTLRAWLFGSFTEFVIGAHWYRICLVDNYITFSLRIIADNILDISTQRSKGVTTRIIILIFRWLSPAFFFFELIYSREYHLSFIFFKFF